MSLLKQTFESFNPNLMKTQVNIPNDCIPQFVDACDMHQIIYKQVEPRENTTRYEIEYTGSQGFWLGATFKDLINSELYERLAK